MAKYKKVKRYHRSFYSPGMWVKKAVGIIVLVAVVLVVGWLAAPHVLDWATHTWYTVVRDRDLSASSAVSESASSGTQSTAASEPAASSVPEKEPEPEVKGTDIVTGLWAEVDVTTLTDEAAIRSAARQLKAQGINLLFFIPCAVLSSIVYSFKKLIDWKSVLLFAAGGLPGVLLGSLAVSHMNSNIPGKIFGGFLLIMGIKELFRKGD